MKKAHLYRLWALFDDGAIWDLEILAVDMSGPLMWVGSHNKDSLVKFDVTLIEKNVQSVEDSFIAKSLNTRMVIS